jgi:hypothetical protein
MARGREGGMARLLAARRSVAAPARAPSRACAQACRETAPPRTGERVPPRGDAHWRAREQGRERVMCTARCREGDGGGAGGAARGDAHQRARPPTRPRPASPVCPPPPRPLCRTHSSSGAARRGPGGTGGSDRPTRGARRAAAAMRAPMRTRARGCGGVMRTRGPWQGGGGPSGASAAWPARPECGQGDVTAPHRRGAIQADCRLPDPSRLRPAARRPLRPRHPSRRPRHPSPREGRRDGGVEGAAAPVSARYPPRRCWWPIPAARYRPGPRPCRRQPGPMPGRPCRGAREAPLPWPRAGRQGRMGRSVGGGSTRQQRRWADPLLVVANHK